MSALILPRNHNDLDAQVISNIIINEIPLSILDPNHPSVGIELKTQILKDRYEKQLIADAIDQRIIYFDQQVNDYCFMNSLLLSSIIGFIFESYIVSIMNNNLLTIGKTIFSWCSNREKCKDDYIQQYKVIATGSVSTRNMYTQFYAPQSKHDIIFIRKNIQKNIYEPAIVNGTTIHAGIQLKAITTNEKEEIILPLLRKEYSHVLTLLKDSRGVHTHNNCMDIIKQMYSRNEINCSEKKLLENRIAYPEQFGIDQREIEDYYQYITYWYNQGAKGDNIIKDGVTLALSGYCLQGGILIPVN